MLLLHGAELDVRLPLVLGMGLAPFGRAMGGGLHPPAMMAEPSTHTRHHQTAPCWHRHRGLPAGGGDGPSAELCAQPANGQSCLAAAADT